MTDKKGELEAEDASTKPKEESSGPINLMELPNVECRCGGMIWEYGFILKRLETKQTGAKNVPIDVIQCKKCGSVLQDGVPLLKRPEK